MPLRDRAQAPQLDEVTPLRPTPVPDSTFVRPPTPEHALQPGNDLLRISSAMGELSPALTRFGQAFIQGREQDSLEAMQAEEAQKTTEQKMAEYKKTGDPGILSSIGFDPVDAARRKLTGQSAGIQAQQDILTELGSGAVDWKSFDPEKHVLERTRQYQDQFSGDRYALSGFNTQMAGFASKLADHKVKQVEVQDTQERQDNTFAALANAASAAKVNGKSPEERADAVFQTILHVAGPGGSQRVEFADANKFTVQLAHSLVDTDRDTAVALLTRPRPTADGKELPPLINTAQHQGEVRAILSAATAGKRKEALAEALNGVTTADAAMLATESGKLSLVRPVEYGDGEGRKTLSASKRQSDAVAQYVDKVSPQIAKERRETLDQTFNRELSNMAHAGVDHPVWKEALTAAPKAVSVNELTDPNKLKQAIQAADLYDQLREKNPLYLNGLVDKPTRDFYESYRVAKTLPGKTIEEALDLARRAAINSDDAEGLKGHYRAIESSVMTADPYTFAQRVFGYARPTVNTGYVQGLVTDRAKLFARLGLPPAQAIDKAAETVRATTVNVNGWVVPYLGRVMPADFPKTVSAYMDDFVKRYGDLNNGVSKSEIGVSHDGAGVFTLHDARGVALRTPGGLARFSLRDLHAFGDAKDAELRADLLTRGQAKVAEEMKDPHRVWDWSRVSDPRVRALIETYEMPPPVEVQELPTD